MYGTRSYLNAWQILVFNRKLCRIDYSHAFAYKINQNIGSSHEQNTNMPRWIKLQLRFDYSLARKRHIFNEFWLFGFPFEFHTCLITIPHMLNGDKWNAIYRIRAMLMKNSFRNSHQQWWNYGAVREKNQRDRLSLVLFPLGGMYRWYTRIALVFVDQVAFNFMLWDYEECT